MTQSTNTATTPCIGVCTLDENNLCIGCFRTCDEIGVWSRLNEEQRQLIMRELEKRKELYFA